MKRFVFLILTVVMCLSLCSCKSNKVKNVETNIGMLNAESTYEEIHSVYTLYSSLSPRNQAKVENLSKLRDYCDPDSGRFVLSDEMLQKIDNKFNIGSLGTSEVMFTLEQELAIKAAVKRWTNYGDIEITSHRREDSYSYVIYGTYKYTDEYGSNFKEKFMLSYFAEYNADESAGYAITDNISLLKY